MARTFDPKKHKENDKGGGGYLDIAGDFVVAITGFSRDKARSGKPFILAKLVVCLGAMKGKRLQERLYLNDESLWKIGKLCEAIGHEEAFDLDDNRQVADAICNRPFKVRTKTRRGDTQTFCDIALFLMKWDPGEREAANEWVAEREAEREQFGDGDYGGGGGFDGSPIPDGPDDFGDDDIPFAMNTVEMGWDPVMAIKDPTRGVVR